MTTISATDWSDLLPRGRFGDDRSVTSDPARNPFERDQDRIIYSTAFRRLAGKTQVFPLPQSDVTHTRLTHTLEVATVGRSLGRLAVITTSKRGGSNKVINLAAEAGAVVAAASLAHDIGNPPFGHSGEAAIGHYFQKAPGNRFLTGLDPAQKADLENFEGNALGFRMLTRTRPLQSSIDGGMRLTYATLAAYLKYPRGSILAKRAHSPKAGRSESSAASLKKFCAFHDDFATLRRVADATQLRKNARFKNAWHRHPLVLLVEAADDICNRIIDLEDSVRVGLVSFTDAIDVLRGIVSQGQKLPRRDRINLTDVESRLDRLTQRNEQLSYMRALAINVLLHQSSDEFARNFDGIVQGEFDSPLVRDLPATPFLARMEDVMKSRVYVSRAVLEVEVAGFEVIAGLLEIFLSAVLDRKAASTSKAIKVRQLLPADYLAAGRRRFEDAAETILAICEYVAGMTDAYAIDLYRKFQGIELPNY